MKNVVYRAININQLKNEPKMKKNNIISKDSTYSFSDYFKLVDYRDEIIEYFGYSFSPVNYKFPYLNKKILDLSVLKQSLEKNIRYIGINTEMAKREFMIAPILMNLIDYVHPKIKVELPLTLNHQLKGTLDYYLQSKDNLLIIEAKNSDLERGFMQLAVELIALDKWTDKEMPILYGAVSTGSIWQFAILNRKTKIINQDLNLFRIPADLTELFSVLIAILNTDKRT
jgi:hypothetical protein